MTGVGLALLILSAYLWLWTLFAYRMEKGASINPDPAHALTYGFPASMLSGVGLTLIVLGAIL